MNHECTFSKIGLEDAPRIQELARLNGGNPDLSAKNINHWYFRNPVKSNSLWKVVYNENIEGYATTNNFVYTIDQEDHLVALPQNVLTSEKVRGKGLFGKLYYKTETENVEENGVDCFFTFTGPMSTPIFLNKFDYLRGKCPPVLIKIAGLPALFSKKKYKILHDIHSIQVNTHYSLPNARKKDIPYFKWRYSECDKARLKIISVTENNETIGYAFLITRKKFGIKTLILADIMCEKEENYSAIIDACHVFATNNFFIALVMFELSCNCRRRGMNVSLKNWFNFLVKGKTKEETTALSKKYLNFFFGDLDYFW